MIGDSTDFNSDLDFSFSCSCSHLGGEDGSLQFCDFFIVEFDLSVGDFEGFLHLMAELVELSDLLQYFHLLLSLDAFGDCFL